MRDWCCWYVTTSIHPAQRKVSIIYRGYDYEYTHTTLGCYLISCSMYKIIYMPMFLFSGFILIAKASYYMRVWLHVYSIPYPMHAWPANKNEEVLLGYITVFPQIYATAANSAYVYLRAARILGRRLQISLHFWLVSRLTRTFSILSHC